ncbi:hypothetical protein AKJ40_01560 [candidate division MSBL1 archaeon SCGC-AAA259M10]|uniref:Cytochrome c-type biogenesis protein CcmE n=2 Tax=candidate division MSBL1 TaxID=215777 RepID=A0A133U5Y9_9EURY|nr:hypothetical protein AKJ62_02695 [candidate division MSBL1 archaeon SCGC-AAA259D14]KXB00301.1 hypothetical protein AKJ40_01560 [candidate division MSBL1 archaeon SCGC-AAA259M10]
MKKKKLILVGIVILALTFILFRGGSPATPRMTVSKLLESKNEMLGEKVQVDGTVLKIIRIDNRIIIGNKKNSKENLIIEIESVPPGTLTEDKPVAVTGYLRRENGYLILKRATVKTGCKSEYGGENE